jgi:hypothetical protein
MLDWECSFLLFNLTLSAPPSFVSPPLVFDVAELDPESVVPNDEPIETDDKPVEIDDETVETNI